MKPYVLKRGPDNPAEPKFSLNYEAELNPGQLAAVTAIEGPILVIAGAGSGKTRTLVYRVARLIESGIPPESILLLTFTRKAAEEMLRRVGGLIGFSSDRVTGGTFHSVANMLLRRYGKAIGLEPGFTILDRSDSEDVINLLRTQHGLNDKAKRFPRKNTINEIFSKAVNKMLPVEDVVLGEFPQFTDEVEDLQKLCRAFEAYKRHRLLVDYDDLLVRLRELLDQDEGLRRRISEAYRYIMVDEYQDTNRLQAELVRKIAATHDNVMVVGDDSQSIYAFRGATFRNIMDFPKLFPGTQLFKLEENYRSTQPILTLANEVINLATEKYSKTLFTRKGEGPAPVLVKAGDENTQSRFVAQRILELREEGVPLEEIAVLFRSSFHSFDLEIELSRRNIPFVKRGGFKFVETAHVKDILAHLRVLENPRDAVSWNRLLMLIEGVGPKKSQALIGAMVAQESGGLDALKAAASKGAGPGAQGLTDLVRLLEELGGSSMTPAEQMNAVYGYYLPILKQQYDDYPKRTKDLEHLYTIAARYGKLDSFLADLTLEPPDTSVFDVEAADRDDERLVLSTIHSAKGLEWHTVFIIWALDGKFPSLYSLTADEDIEEERRLFYVAITRAKLNLYVSYPVNVFDRASGMVLSKPSRFIDEVRQDCLDSWSLIDDDDFRD
ncbi:MAG TPA: ATP-dependent helicase [Nitrospirales bacterium]|nr:ATP-dependent helicase [Nitrospirales bacterium]